MPILFYLTYRTTKGPQSYRQGRLGLNVGNESVEDIKSKIESKFADISLFDITPIMNITNVNFVNKNLLSIYMDDDITYSSEFCVTNEMTNKSFDNLRLPVKLTDEPQYDCVIM